jgi:CRISPR/Cas system CSM-associated protein Csm3 (group 7 of RAMP superfamily)
MSISSLAFTLNFSLQSYWHIGSGLEGGAYADALVLKNTEGLPYIPGKSIKGLLKEAFTVAHQNNWFADAVCDDLLALLFGVEGQGGIAAQGILQISSASLSRTERSFFAQNPAAIPNLYKVTYATAIDETTGVAKDTSLRSMEVAVPMDLAVNVAVNTQHPHYGQFDKQINKNMALWLSQVISLITQLGAKRHRGLGKVSVSITSPKNAAVGGL